MTYEWQGRQFVVIAAGGYGSLESTGKPLADTIVAFALELSEPGDVSARR